MHTTTAPKFHTSLTDLLGWITSHPHIPVSHIDFADHEGAELHCPAGQFDALTTAANAADALDDPVIEVVDPPGRDRVTQITVTGDIPGTLLEICVESTVYDHARVALLTSLGAPPIPGSPMWHPTAAHLRDVVDTADAERAMRATEEGWAP